jgi:hypothetical protein
MQTDPAIEANIVIHFCTTIHSTGGATMFTGIYIGPHHPSCAPIYITTVDRRAMMRVLGQYTEVSWPRTITPLTGGNSGYPDQLAAFVEVSALFTQVNPD